jgi:hypothetical protein
MRGAPRTAYQAVEPIAGASYRARAEAAFLAAVARLLPDLACGELEACAPGDAAAWTRRWHLDCAAVHAWARGHAVARRFAPAVGLGVHGSGYERPAELQLPLAERARTLNAPSMEPLEVIAMPEALLVERIKRYRSALAEVAVSHGCTPIAAVPQLERDVEWLVRYQLGQSVAVLAKSVGSTPGAVRQVVRRGSPLRVVLGLAPRRGAGRPRVHAKP